MSLVNNCAPSSLSLSFCKYFSRLLSLSLSLSVEICWKRGCLTVFLVAAFVYNYCIISLCVEIAARCCVSKFARYFHNSKWFKCVLIIIYFNIWLGYDVRYCLRTAAFYHKFCCFSVTPLVRFVLLTPHPIRDSLHVHPTRLLFRSALFTHANLDILQFVYSYAIYRQSHLCICLAHQPFIIICFASDVFLFSPSPPPSNTNISRSLTLLCSCCCYSLW